MKASENQATVTREPLLPQPGSCETFIVKDIQAMPLRRTRPPQQRELNEARGGEGRGTGFFSGDVRRISKLNTSGSS